MEFNYLQNYDLISILDFLCTMMKGFWFCRCEKMGQVSTFYMDDDKSLNIFQNNLNLI